MVMNPSRGSLTRVSSISATMTRMRSDSLRARPASTMAGAPLRKISVCKVLVEGGAVGLEVLVGAQDAPLRGEQLDLGSARDEPLTRVEDLAAVPRVRR